MKKIGVAWERAREGKQTRDDTRLYGGNAWVFVYTFFLLQVDCEILPLWNRWFSIECASPFALASTAWWCPRTSSARWRQGAWKWWRRRRLPRGGHKVPHTTVQENRRSKSLWLVRANCPCRRCSGFGWSNTVLQGSGRSHIALCTKRHPNRCNERGSDWWTDQ